MIVECPRCTLRYDVTGRPPGTRGRCRCGATFTLPDRDAEATAVSCPKCGGATSPKHNRCDYCGIALAVVRCPRCFALQFEGLSHCGGCGGSLANPARNVHEDGDTPLNCPRCQNDLEASLAGETLMDQCTDCGGLWLDHTVFDALTAERERQSSVGAALSRMPSPAVTPDTREVKYLKCPECETLMHRKNFARCSGVIVDVCTAHGIWFDRDELSQIMDFIRLGGMEKARQMERDSTKTTVHVSVDGKTAGLPPFSGDRGARRLADFLDGVFHLLF